MNRKRLIRYGLFSGLFFLAVGGAATIYTRMQAISPSRQTPGTETSLDRDAVDKRGQPPEEHVAQLYFSDKDKPFLVAEERMLTPSDDPVVYGKTIVKALISGPQTDLATTLPRSTGLRGLFVTEPGIAYIDLTGNVMEEHPGGSETELMAVYSIVNSLVLNIPRIRAVKILIDGRESMTLAGHIDLRSAFKANLLLIR
ncbi:MAG: GerMN domain-containing protein [Desulfobacterales bacterium]